MNTTNARSSEERYFLSSNIVWSIGKKKKTSSEDITFESNNSSNQLKSRKKICGNKA